MVRMFRSFEASIERREIHWVRRRDHEIVKYLLLKRDGSATREEIAATFWPNADRHLATQSVRTAISKIRKAIAEAVGSGCVDRYFRTTPDLHVDLDNVVCDVRRFAAHFSDGEAALNAGDPNGAEMNLRACYKLYRGRLLEFDGEREWFAGSAATMQERYLLALEWLGELALERGDTTAAQLYIFHARSQAPERVGVTRLMERLSLAQCAVAAQLGSVPQIESGTALQGLQPA
jgi:DNA-binding SARP family transcriptional activator